MGLWTTCRRSEAFPSCDGLQLCYSHPILSSNVSHHLKLLSNNLNVLGITTMCHRGSPSHNACKRTCNNNNHLTNPSSSCVALAPPMIKTLRCVWLQRMILPRWQVQRGRSPCKNVVGLAKCEVFNFKLHMIYASHHICGMLRRFGDAALTVFGSGWTWLGVDSQGGLVITTTPNQVRAGAS